MGLIILNGEQYGSFEETGFPPLIYSDEEREVGVWRDGKPLYQKVVFVASVSKSGSISLGIANVDKIFLVTGQCYNGATLPYIHGAVPSVTVGGFFNIASQDTTFELRGGNDATDPVTDVYLIVQYTKTTDVPGSGKYTTYGGIARHYSTTEQVIGTWINGKPLYEKVLEISRQGGFPSGDYEIYSNAGSFHLIPDGLLGMFYNSSGSQYLVPWASCGGSSTNSTSLYKNSSGKIILAVRNDSYESYALEVVLRYTKTTD